MAARLAEAGRSTLLIEAGPAVDGDRRPRWLASPEDNPELFWPPVAEPDRSGEDGIDTSHQYWMGRALGGGSAVNGMLISPGDRADYDRWAGLDGCSDWSADAMAPFLATATAALGPEASPPDPDDEDVVAAFDDGFGQIGLQPAGTTLDADRCGLFTPVLATRAGNRRSVADAYLVGHGPALTVWTDRTVAALAVDDAGRVDGVVLTDGQSVRASTVVLAAGTVGSAALLASTGGVARAGEWVRNHEASALTFPWPSTPAVGRGPTVHRVARWSSTTRSHQVANDPGAIGPDLSAVLMGPFPGATGLITVMASTVGSSGRLDVSGSVPRIETDRLRGADDRARLRHGTRRAIAVCRELTNLGESGDRSSPYRRELAGLRDLSDRELDRWLVQHPGPVYHAVGSCRMGGDGAVTAAEPGRAGTVPELDGVVVADASLFPDLVAGGLQLPVMAVAERIVAETLLGG